MFEIGKRKMKLANGYILVVPVDEKEELGPPSSLKEKDEIYDFLFDDLQQVGQEVEKIEIKSRFVLCRVEDVADDVFSTQVNATVFIPIQALELFENGGLKNKFLTKSQYIIGFLAKGGGK